MQTRSNHVLNIHYTVVLQRLHDKTIKEGERLILEVQIEYRGPEPIIKWYREGLIIRNSPDYQITVETGTSRLAVAEVFPEDTGVYKCVATNADGSDSTEAMLRVIGEWGEGLLLMKTPCWKSNYRVLFCFEVLQEIQAYANLS